ncbi:creatininase family protein [Mediterraneibacter sp. NSJ-55]|uniref:Creatininase family protein n=1 Tax=Mediterraneibacter hominis TaxID=2763054 RepID=A0A923LLH0_9FIRM|nr:creatininase family protein [Mediterraneibacter hominis]MBC5690099.1 creatininase family protein [Mediterraneibacter hominis]
MKKVFLNEMSAREVKAMLEHADEVTAITCFGSCESHGWHCCLGPDFFVPTEVAKRVAEKLDNVVVVPAVPFGTSIHYNQYPMSVTLRYDTEIAIAEDIFESLINNGIKHIYILNGHDGNIPALEIAAHNVKDRHKDAKFLYMPAWWNKVGPIMGDRFEVWNGLGHGGEGETSIMMAVRPELVNLEYAESQVPEKVIDVNKTTDIIWDIKEITKTGATGDPTKASIEKGNQMLDILVGLVADAIEEMNRTDWTYGTK